MSKCHLSVISLKSFFAVLQSRLHKEFWLLIYPVNNLHFRFCSKLVTLVLSLFSLKCHVLSQEIFNYYK